MIVILTSYCCVHFQQEAGLQIDRTRKEPFTELNRILEACRLRNLDPALE